MVYQNKYFKLTVWALLIALLLYLLSQLTFILNPIGTVLTIVLLPILIASLFYYILRPLVRFLVSKNVHKTIASLGVLLVLAGLIVFLVIYAGGTIQEEFSSFYETLIEYVQQAQEKAKELMEQDEFWIFSLEDIESRLTNSAEMVFGVLGENLFGWIGNITTFTTILILIPVVVFFLLKDEKHFYDKTISLISPENQIRTIAMLKDMDNALSMYFVGQLIVAFFLGVLTYVGYLIIGLPNSLFLATFTMFTSIIPFLGPLLGILPAIFIAWTVDLFMVAKVIIVLAVTQQLEGNVVRPQIMGNRLEIHPLLIIFLVIISITLYGFIGAFFAIPFYAILRIIVRNVLQNRKQKDKGSSDIS